MSRSIFLVVSLFAGFCASAALAAQDAPASSSSAQSSAHPSKRTAVKPGDRNCLRSTGSRIPAKKGSCLAVTGRSYSQQDLQRTGELDVGSALQALDPSITVNGH